MATYNTAFGALPGIETLTGVKRPRQDEEQPRDFLQQQRAQQQAQRQSAQQAPAQTFAQMQAAGQARPAPPMLAPAPTPAPAAPLSPMMQQLQQQLAPAPAPAPAPTPAPAMPSAAISMSAPPLAMAAPAMAAEGPAPSPAGANLIVPLDKQVPTQLSPADVQRLNDLERWRQANPQLANDPFFFTTNKLVPTAGGGFTTRPKTDDELRAEGRVPLWEQGVRGRWEGETFVPDPTGTPGGGRGRWANWTPPTEEAATTPAPQTGAPGMGTFGAGAPGMGAPTTGAPAAPAIPPAPLVPLPDYARLTAVTPAERYTGSEQAMELRRRLAEQLDLIGRGPPEIQGQAYEAMRQAKLADITAQFGAQRSQLEEELAARGLSASTIGAGRYGDVAGQQARAIAALEADLLQQQAEAEARNRQLYLTSMGQLAGMAGEQDLGTFEANLRARQVENDIAFRAAELQQDAALKGRELTLQQARDQAQTEYQRGQLQLGYAEMGSREKMQTQQQTFEAGQNALERQLRETMQIRQLTSEEKRTLDQLTLQREQLAEEKRRNLAGETFRDREFEEQKRATGVLEAMRQGELTLSQGTRLISIINQIYNGDLPIEAWDTMLRSIGLDPAKWVSYKPAARTPAPSPTTNTPPTGPGAGNPPVTVGQAPPPSELSQYSNGQRFVINGVIYYLMNGRLVDGQGRPYAGSSE